jgi:chemotaxis response regulator CheB
MKTGNKSEAANLHQKAEEPLVSHKSKAGSISSETINLKLIPETIKKPIAGKETAITTVSKPARRNISTPRSFPIVGIGASAGGLEALGTVFCEYAQRQWYGFRGYSTSRPRPM